jgi:sterol desaturase/sphingolipid hydroxylase (fatty acid hydroxylase superfamily)
MERVRELLVALQATLVLYVFAVATMTALELVTARERHSLRSRLPGLLFWVLWTVVATVTYGAFHLLWRRVGIEPLIVLPLGFGWAGVIAIVAAPLASAFVADFFFYWCHRAQHRWLWRFHAVHHSVRELNSTNSFHHVSEPLIQTVLIVLPSSLIVSETGAMVPVIALLLHMQSSYIHSSSRWHMGPLRAIFVDNRFHRIHHSLERQHYDRNFGAVTTLWDRLFGTAHFPKPDEWPATGIHEVDQPRTLRARIDQPRRLARAEQDIRVPSANDGFPVPVRPS